MLIAQDLFAQAQALILDGKHETRYGTQATSCQGLKPGASLSMKSDTLRKP